VKIILGIDPGSSHTGFGILRVSGDRIEHLEHGVCSPPSSLSFARRLHHIASSLDQLFKRVKPDVTVVERIFLGKNADSAFKLGHVRGVCILAAVHSGASVFEYAARSVKKGITGNGASSKEQVQMILFASLGLRGVAQIDASDALALAYYHARNMDVQEAMRRQGVQIGAKEL
jgi:crossover junction endodeoxyribonuclease RuvC